MLTDVYLVYACKMLIISDVYNVYDVNACVSHSNRPSTQGHVKSAQPMVMRFLSYAVCSSGMVSSGIRLMSYCSTSLS